MNPRPGATCRSRLSTAAVTLSTWPGAEPFWMIDEENDTFFHVSRQGQILSRHYAPGFRGGYSPTPEAGEPTRVRGAGFEGIAISPDGNTVYGGHQTALATFPEGEADVTFIAALHIPTNTWRVYKVPLDPVTDSATTWLVVAPADPQKGGVYDVKSGAQGQSLDGSEFSTW